MRQQLINRVRIILIATIVVAVILITRLYFLQVVHGEEYRAEAAGQYVSSNGNFYDRGAIFFSNKKGHLVSAGTIKTGYTLAINPSRLDDAQKLYDALSEKITLNKVRFFKSAAKSNDPYEELVRKLTKEERDAIDAIDDRAIILVPERWRYYPGNTLAAHTIGFIAYAEDKKIGRYGLERYYEQTLKRDKNDLYVNFFAEIFTNLRELTFNASDEREGDVITTIEPSVQLYLEEMLKKTTKEWHSQKSAGIIMDPQTGEIIALAVDPGFDVNNFGKVKNQNTFANPLTERVYEMGSIIKPLTMAAGIDSGAVTAQTTYNDKGHLTFNGATIHNYDFRGRGVVPMQEVLSQSLNTGVAFITGKMGNKKLREYFLDRYKMGEETGIDLPGEVAGLVSNLDSPRDIEYMTASFGQGIALTPIATVRALATLANGGKLVQPHIVKKIRYKTGLSKTFDYTDEIEQVLKPESAEDVTRMLVKVVDEVLAGGKEKMEHYSIGVKTGTAQIAKPRGGYYEDRYLHSYFGYGPAYDSRFIVFLMTIEPKQAKYASQTLTKPFMNIMKYLLNYYDVPPDR